MDKRSQSAIDWQEGRRLRAWELHQAGWKQVLIAQALGVTPGAVSQWVSCAKQNGQESLLKRKAIGGKSKLSTEQKKQIPELLNRGAEKFGFRGDVWTTGRIREVIQREFGITYHKSHIARILHEIGWSQQKPLRQANKRNEEAVREWKEKAWPDIHKAEEQGYTVIFIDEAGFYLLPSVVRTWAPRGQTPILHYEATRDHLSTIAAITSTGDLFLEMQEVSFDGPRIIEFLTHLQSQIPNKLFIVWDRISIHRGSAVKQHTAKNLSQPIKLKYFPGYASDLNPVEGIWNHLKNVELRNVCCLNISELKQELAAAEARLRKRPEIIFSCLRQVGYY